MRTMRRNSKKERQLPNYNTKFHISSVILKIYLIPLAKICLFLWLIVSGKVIAGFTIYMLFGLYELYSYKKNESSHINNWIVTIISSILLWPALDIFSFFPPKDTDFD